MFRDSVTTLRNSLKHDDLGVEVFKKLNHARLKPKISNIIPSTAGVFKLCELLKWPSIQLLMKKTNPCLIVFFYRVPYMPRFGVARSSCAHAHRKLGVEGPQLHSSCSGEQCRKGRTSTLLLGRNVHRLGCARGNP